MADQLVRFATLASIASLRHLQVHLLLTETFYSQKVSPFSFRYSS
jgi:hypothetical protein